MRKPITMYQTKCDGCGALFEDGGNPIALEAAFQDDWLTGNGWMVLRATKGHRRRDLCPQCKPSVWRGNIPLVGPGSVDE